MIASSWRCWAPVAFSRAAFTPAARRASRPLAVNPVDLELPGPGRRYSIEFGDEAHGGGPVPADPTMSLGRREQDVLPPARGALSLEQLEFRCEVCATAESAFATSAAPGAARTYEAALRATFP